MKSNPFKDFVEHQLEDVPGLRFRRMFGGFGIYSGDVFFGIIHKENLYFRTNATTRKRYEDSGMTVFITPARKKALKKYYEVPLSVIEQRTELIEWARDAVKSVDEP